MTDTTTWARVHVLNLSIGIYREAQLDARRHRNRFLDEFWGALIDDAVSRWLVANEQLHEQR